MKLNCQRSLLLSAFQTVSGVVPTRTPKEILRNIKLHVEDRRATLIGTDTEVGIRYELPEVETDSAGEILLPTQRVSQILREVQDPSVQLEANEDALTIRAGTSEFRLSMEDPAEFPDVSRFTDESYHTVPARLLRQSIERTEFAADTESTRYALGGIRLELNPGTITLAATDSRRLAVVHGTCSAHGSVSEEQGQPVVPVKAMQLIQRSLVNDDEDVCIAVHSNDVLVRAGHSTIYSRLVEGRFPKYQDVIPREFQTSLQFVVAPLMSAVRQAMIVTNEESRGVDFTFGGGLLTLASKATDVGTSRIEVPISYDGDELVVTFDPRFVVDFLKVLEPSDQITLHLIDGNSAAVFQADDSYTYVVMPLARQA